MEIVGERHQPFIETAGRTLTPVYRNGQIETSAIYESGKE
jgi:hypothetical protein